MANIMTPAQAVCQMFNLNVPYDYNTKVEKMAELLKLGPGFPQS